MDTTTARATRREWIGLAVLALPTMLLSLDIGVLYLALPNLATDLGASGTQQLWILDIYSFMLAGFLVTMGTLGDRIGRRKLLLIGAAAFGVASVVAAYSTTAEMLILSRALLGVAGATLMPSTMALIRNMFSDPKQMGTAIGVWFACFVGGMALGPLVGGVLLERFWWGSAFLLGVPFMVLLLIAGPRLLPEYRDAKAGRLDLTSVVLSLAAILPVIYGLKSLARNGFTTVAVVTIVVGLGFGAVFVRRQRRLADPMLDLGLFANRTFSTSMATMLLGGVVMAGATLMSTLYLQVASGLSPMHAGLWMVPENVALIIGSVAGPMLARRLRASTVVMLGLGVCVLGMLVMTQVPSTGGIGLLVTGLALASFGIAVPMTVTMTLIMGAAPPEKAGAAASMQETGGEFGVAMGVAAMGSIGTLVYRDQLAGTMPASVPEPTADAVRESLTAAATAVAELPAALGGEVLEAARNAFTSGLNVTAVVGAAIFAGLAVLAGIVLRRTDANSSGADVESAEPASTSV